MADLQSSEGFQRMVPFGTPHNAQNSAKLAQAEISPSVFSIAV
jgi:hypothetical protein